VVKLKWCDRRTYNGTVTYCSCTHSHPAETTTVHAHIPSFATVTPSVLFPQAVPTPGSKKCTTVSHYLRQWPAHCLTSWTTHIQYTQQQLLTVLPGAATPLSYCLLFIGVTGDTARDLPLPPQHIHGTAQNAISSQQPCEQCAEMANNLPVQTANFKGNCKWCNSALLMTPTIFTGSNARNAKRR